MIGDGPTGRLATANEILRTTVGSQVHGLAIEGTDDHDEMGIFVEPKERVYGTKPPLDTYSWRTQPEGVRSGPGDTDLVMYSLRHYLRLAGQGNPTVLLPLYAPDEFVLSVGSIGEDLRQRRNMFLSKAGIERFLGYMKQQHIRMMGGGKRNRVPNRPELIEKYGWDTKYGSHAVRLALQALQIIREGTLTLPMPEHDRDFVRSVKTGAQRRDDINWWLTVMEDTVRKDLAESALPDQPHWPTINKWSIEAHESHWSKGRRR